MRYWFIVLFFFAMHAVAQSDQHPNLAAQNETNEWAFICERYALTGIAKVQIAKSGKGGILKLNVESTGKDFYISGPVYVYLFDHTVIVCKDRGLRMKTENGIGATYVFSAAEFAKLQRVDIESIRFSIKGSPKPFESQVGNFTAINKKSYFTGLGKDEKNYYLTAAEIAALK